MPSSPLQFVYATTQPHLSIASRYLRRILVVGACAVLRYARQQPQKYPWLTQLLARKPFKVVAVALANKMARIAWALLAKGGTYRAPALAAARPPHQTRPRPLQAAATGLPPIAAAPDGHRPPS